MDYVAPPIVEAVVQITFANSLDLAEVHKFGELLSKTYPTKSDRVNLSGVMDIKTGEVKAEVERIGLEFKDVESNKIVILERTSIVLSRLAPYPGWNDFLKWISEEIAVLHKALKGRKVSRIGMRFLNRIDVPFINGLAKVEDYVSIYPQQVSFGGENFSRFFVSFSRSIEGTDLGFNLSCGTTDSPVPNNAAVLLDIDVFHESARSFGAKWIEEKLHSLRLAKNVIFEQSITDSSRLLFGVKNAQ
jgi:uncharacterized protein (TIGR04255 family)